MSVALKQRNTIVKLVAKLESTLGEGPCWDSRVNHLYWVDIKQGVLFSLNPDTGDFLHWSFDDRPSFGGPDKGDGVVLVTDTGLSRFNPVTSSRETFLPLPPDLPTGFRSNDAKIDGSGALWWSVMDDDGGKRPGAVYRYAGGENRLVVQGVHIANSLAFSPDGRTAYLSDSVRRTLWRYPVERSTGALGARQVFAVFTQGEPDGAAVDVEGGLWVAVWGGWRVDRFLPDGQLDFSVPMPVAQPTAVAFGGRNLDTLYVTSAREGLSADALARQRMAGSLFGFDAGVRGLAIPAFAG